MHFQRLTPEQLITKLAAIVDSSEDAIIGRDENGVIETWNAAAARAFGYSSDEMIGRSMLLIVPPELHAEELANLERIRRGEAVTNHETERLRKGGGRVHISAAISPIKDAEGRVIGSALIARNTGSCRQEAADRARLYAIVNSSDDAIVAKDLNGVITDWNPAAERIFGYKAEEIVGRSVLTIIPPDLQHEEPVILRKICAGERIEHFETQRITKSGRRIDISLSISPIRDSRGKIIGASKIARDITDRKRLDSARLMLAAIVESSDDAIVSKNLDGIITSWNAAAERLFGYKEHEIVGHSVLRLIPNELHHEEPLIIGKLRSGERIEHFETRRMRKNGEVFHVSLTVSPIKNEHGQVIGASKIVRDISERKAAEAAILDRERLATAGRLAATLAHEVNNPLEAITNLAYLLNVHPSLDSEAKKFAQSLVNEVARAGEITRTTLNFYRESRISGAVDMNAIVKEILESKSRKLKHRPVRLDYSCVASEKVQGFGGELRQVLDNIIDNAIFAVGDTGRVFVRSRLIRSDASRKVVVSICDDGPGIPATIKNRIFDPFFTTKLQSGNGLGLWVSRSIVEKHGGKILVRSRETGSRHGTVFTVILPTAGVVADQNLRETPRMSQAV